MEIKLSLQTPTFLRLTDMRTRYRVSGSTIWNWCKTNGLPAPHKLGANTTVWKLSDLLKWEASRTSANVDCWAQSRIDVSEEE